MEKEMKRINNWDEYLSLIREIHGCPCYMLLRIEANQTALISVASNPATMQLVMNTKEKDNVDYIC